MEYFEFRVSDVGLRNLAGCVPHSFRKAWSGPVGGEMDWDDELIELKDVHLCEGKKISR